ncbi:MAG: hypothetical protein VX026_06330 [Myxococcota bacterium]|nr:hypothetical protein [Myxococcota bacterium]
MPFSPIPMLILYDDTNGFCRRVLPGLEPLLAARGFSVQSHRIQDGPIDTAPYKGLIIGSPVSGLGLKGAAPTDALFDYVQHLDDFERHQVAVFCVYPFRLGTSLDRMKGMVLEKGGTIVAARAYSLMKFNPNDHVIAAECMVRIR